MTYRVIMTCQACPEQYDVFADDKRVGYIRLRGGRFRVDVPDVGGATILTAQVGDKYDGAFTDEERPRYLQAAVNAIAAYERGEYAVVDNVDYALTMT